MTYEEKSRIILKDRKCQTIYKVNTGSRGLIAASSLHCCFLEIIINSINTSRRSEK